MRWIVGFAFILAFVAAHARPPLEIKGVKPGMPFNEAASLFQQKRCYGTFCTVETSIGGTKASLFVGSAGDVVDQVYVSKMDASGFDVVSDAFRAKFGKPDESTTLTVQNGYGSKFECPVYVWNFPDGRLTVSKFRPDTLLVPRIEFESAARLESEEKKKKAASSDL